MRIKIAPFAVSALMLVSTTAVIAAPLPQVVSHATPVMTNMAVPPQMQQISAQLAEQQAKISQLEAKLDALTSKTGANANQAGKHLTLIMKSPPKPSAYPKPNGELASSAAGMRVLSTKFSTVATNTDKPAQITVIPAAQKIPLQPSATAVKAALQGLPPSAQQQIDQLSATVNQLRAALVQDEKTIQQLSGAQWAVGVRVLNDEINSSNLADNVSGFESTATTELQNHAGAIDLLQGGVLTAYGLACNDLNGLKSAVNASGVNAYPLQMEGYGLSTVDLCQ
jgi:uncharacterized coiled-coil protein SlyX